MSSGKKLVVALLLTATLPALSQKPQLPSKDAPKATVVHAATLYVQGDASSDKLGTVSPGREIVVLERSSHWLRVYANTDIETVREQDVPVFTSERATPPISGWMPDRGVITADTPQGDAILFGEAIATEQAAAEPHAPAGAAEDARRLYRMTAELFPQSARAAEAAWRSADIRWQMQKADAASLPSAHEKENYLRQLPDESEMKKLQKLYPGSKWADYAAFRMIDNKLCGDWQGSEKCPEKEATYYAKYAEDRPDSQRTPEALYRAAWRLACAGDMWVADNEEKKAGEDRARALDLGGRLVTKYAQSDWAARGADLLFKVQQQIPIYGNDRE